MRKNYTVCMQWEISQHRSHFGSSSILLIWPSILLEQLSQLYQLSQLSCTASTPPFSPKMACELVSQIFLDEIGMILENGQQMDMAIGTIWAEAAACLKKHGLMYERLLHTDEVFVHPDNRGKLGLNHHNVHRNIGKIKKVGGDGSKLVGATCFELSCETATRDRQVKFNLKLITQSNGMLAPATGKERFLSVATGHAAAGVRAINAGCKSTCVELVDLHGKLSVDRWKRNDDVCAEMAEKGWEFWCIPWQVEKCVPRLPFLAQRALNSSNDVASQQSELECASVVSEFASQSKELMNIIDWAACIEEAAASAPPCEEYIKTIGEFVKNYGGGEGSPLISYLDHLSKAFGTNKILGKDFWGAVTYLDLPSDFKTYVFIRIACLSLNISSSKVVDGFARFIQKEQVESLRGKSLRKKVDGVEDALKLGWDLTLKSIKDKAKDHADAYRCFGVMCARSMMYVLGNGKSGFEKKDYKSLDDIVKQFLDAMGGAVETAQTSTSDAAETSGSMVSLNESNDPKWIAVNRGYVIDKHYNLKSTHGRIFKLTQMTDDEGCRFVEVIVPPTSSPPEFLVPFTDLKNWSEYKGLLPKMVETPDSTRGVANNRIEAELAKCVVFQAVSSLAKEHVGSEKLVSYQINPTTLRCACDVKKGELVLVPFTESVTKVGGKQTPTTADAKLNGVRFYIEPPPRATVADASEWPKNALFGGYWWVDKSPDAPSANMVYKTVKHENVSIAVFTNSRALKSGEKLMKWKEVVEKRKVEVESFAAPPPAKRLSESSAPRQV